MSCTSAELVYGTTLRLPGDFFSNPTVEDPSSFVSRLRHSMQRQQFVPTRWHGSHDTYLPPDLHTASHVYVRRDDHKPPLTRPYVGPYQVLRRSTKHFALDVNGKIKEYSVGSLKPAKLECSQATPASKSVESVPCHPAIFTPHQALTDPTTTTQAGRSIRRPVRLNDYVTDW